MPQLSTLIWGKPGATFSNAEEAYSDRTSLVPPDIMQSYKDFNQTMMDEGILLQPPTLAWKQADSILSIGKMVTDIGIFQARKNDTVVPLSDYARAAGWIPLDQIVVDL